MSLTTILQHCLTGISLGGAYALIAIGYTMVYGILRLINFAHGDIFMMAGYFMIFAMASIPWPIAIPLVILGTVVLGVVIERAAYKPLRTAPRMSIMISAIGVSYLLQNLATYLFTAIPKGYPEIPFLKRIFKIGDLSASLVTFITPVLTIVLVLLLMALMSVTPFSGTLPGLKCFVAAVFGGIGSIPGAVVGGFVIGICETLLVAMGYSTFSDAFTFLLLIVMLLFRPTGLFGEKSTDKV